MGELDALELHLFAQDPTDELVLALHRQALAPYRAVVEAANVVDRTLASTPDYPGPYREMHALSAALKALDAALRAHEDADSAS